MTNDFYKITMSSNKLTPARLYLYGVIGGGFFEDGFDEIEFNNKMSYIGEDQPIDIYLNSPGGSFFAGLAIYNRLKLHKGAIKIYVMGIAASAATLITSVPNATVIMPIGSMLMVHGIAISANRLKINELKDLAVSVEKMEQSAIEVYKAKTKLKDEDLEELMKHESYMTAIEAVDKGFADELDNSIKIENTIISNRMINGVKLDEDFFANAPNDFLMSINGIESSEKNNFSTKKEELKMTLEEMKIQFPELCKQLENELKENAFNEGVKSERSRIQAIDNMAMVGREDIINKAKFETGITAEKLAVEIVTNEARIAKAFDNLRQEDAKDLNNIENIATPEPGSEMTAEEKQVAAFVAAGKKILNKNKED